jgi:transcriptional regulator with XRE-family HTH domain
MPNIHAQVASQVKAILKARSMSADRLALEINMSRGFLYEFLNGKKKAGLDSLQRIADGLEVEVRDLFPAKKAKGQPK